MTYEQPAVLSRLEGLELRARRIVEGWLVGRQASPYLGAATEFAGHRAYVMGDEPRRLDWKVYARTKRLVVKQFHEETHLPCWIVVDASRSMKYGDAAKWSKFDHAATLAVCFAYLLTGQQDPTGLILATSGGLRVAAPRAQSSQVELIARSLQTCEPAGDGQFAAAIRAAAPHWSRRGLVILIGDFLDQEDSLPAALGELRGRRQETLVCQVLHGDELEFPFEGLSLFRGLESTTEVESDPRALRRAYLDNLSTFLTTIRKACTTAGADHFLVDMRATLAAALTRYLGFRHERL